MTYFTVQSKWKSSLDFWPIALYDEYDENCTVFLNNLIKTGKYRELEKFYEDYLIEYQNEHKIHEEEIDELDYWDGRDGWSPYHDESICNK